MQGVVFKQVRIQATIFLHFDKKLCSLVPMYINMCNASTYVLYIAVNVDIVGLDPTIVSCNSGSVENYNVTSSLVRFQNKNNFFYFLKAL
jgi:hypothetical protein